MRSNFALILRFVMNSRLGNNSMCSTAADLKYHKSILHMPEDVRAKYQLVKCLKDSVFFNNDEYVATVKPFGVKNSVNVVKYVNRLPAEERDEIMKNIDPNELYLTDVIPMLAEALNEQLLLVSRSIPPNVSGILLLSKSKKAFQRFDSFSRQAAKENIPYMKFLCVCVGTPRYPEGEDEFHIVKVSDGEKSVLDIGDGRYTQSQIKRQRCAVFPMKYRVVASNKDLSVLEIQTLALDWHNYRLYALDKGAPILGDHLYQRRIARILGKSVFVPFKSASERNQIWHTTADDQDHLKRSVASYIEPFLTTADIDAWASVFWEEASAEFKIWWKSQRGVEYLARQKPFWGFMKRLCWMFKNPSLTDDHLASHLWNILPPGARAERGNADDRYIEERIGLTLPRF